MWYHLLVTVVVLGALMAGWLGLQAWVRRRMPGAPADCDLLEGRFGCVGCALAGHCKRAPTRGQSPTERS